MAQIVIPFGSVLDDAGAIVSGATVTIQSVKSPLDDSDIASHGATVVLSSDGKRLGVLYDVAAKGEAWITLSVSKSGSTFTGANANPVAFAAVDAQSIASALTRVLLGVPNAAPGAATGVARTQDVPTAAENAAAVQSDTSLADLAEMISGDGTAEAKFTANALINAPSSVSNAATLHEGPYTIYSEDAGSDGLIRSFVGDTRRILFRVLDANRSIIPLTGTITAVLTNVDTGVSGSPITVDADSIAANVGSVDVPTPTAGKFRLTVRMVSGGLTTTAGPIVILVSAR